MTLLLTNSGVPITTQEYINQYDDVQIVLSKTNELSSEEIEQKIEQILNMKEANNFTFLLKELLYAYSDTISNKNVLFNLILKYIEKIPEFNTLLMGILPKSSAINAEKVVHFRILRRLFLEKLVSIKEIIQMIYKFPKDVENQYFLFVSFFIKEIDIYDKATISEFYNTIKRFQNLSPSFYRIFQDNVERIMVENPHGPPSKWNKYIDFLETGSTGLFDMIKRDDIQMVSIRTRNEPLEPLPKQPLSSEPLLSASPNILQVAALLNAKTCFKDLSHKRDLEEGKDAAGRSLAVYVAAGGRTDFMEVLLRHEQIPPKGERSPVRVAPLNLTPLALRALPQSLRAPDSALPTRGVLSSAVSRRRFEMADFLLEGVSLSREDIQEALVEAAAANSPRLVRRLLGAGADVAGRVGEDEQTALHAAAAAGAYEAALQLLITPGCVVNARDARGQTPLHAAAASGAQNVLRALSSIANADSSARDIYGNTPGDVGALRAMTLK